MRIINWLCVLLLLPLAACSEKNSIELVGIESETQEPYVGEVITLKATLEKPVIKSFGNIIYFQKTDILPSVEGTIKRIFVEEGQAVRKGQILAELENLQLDIQMKKAQAALQSAQVSYNLAETKYEEAMRNGESIFLNQEKMVLELKQKEMDLKELVHDLENKRSLFELEGIPEEEVRKLEISYESSKIDYSIKQKDIEINSIGYRDEDLIKAGYYIPDDLAEKRRLLIELNNRNLAAEVEVAQSRVQSAQAEIDALNILLSQLKILCPQTGILGAKYFETGEKVKQDSKMFTTFSSQKVYLNFPVQEKDVLKLYPDQKVSVTIPALDSREYEGLIKIISPTIDPQSGNLQVKALISNTDLILKPGIFAEVKIDLGIEEKRIFVPEGAFVKRDREKGTLYLVKNKRIYLKDCSFDLVENETVRIIGGLSEGDRILLNPAPFLKEGQYVQDSKI